MELVCEPFVDDGYSGVSFNRPQFKKLEEAIRKGALDCIVVKDFSRFSRNYIDGGRYIEKIFPQLGIRYFQCIHSVNNGHTDCPVGRNFSEMDIENVVFHALTQFLALAQKEAVQNREVGDLRKSAIKECAEENPHSAKVERAAQGVEAEALREVCRREHHEGGIHSAEGGSGCEDR